MKKYFIYNSKYVILILFASGFIYFFSKHPFINDKLQTIQNNLIVVSGILTGIVIAYLSAKLFQIVQQREARQEKINHLSDKLTIFRKLLYRIMISPGFWIYYEDIDKFKKKYNGITFTHLHEHKKDNKSDLVSQFWLDEKDIDSTTADLYLAMEEITGSIKHAENWVYDKVHSYNYNIDYLSRCLMPANQIWYYLEGKYEKHTEGVINDQKILVYYRDEIREFATQIDSKFRNKDFDRHLLAEIGTDFHEMYIPKLIELSGINQKGIPKSMVELFITWTIILTSGVIVPLIILTLDLTFCVSSKLTFLMVLIVICGLISFLFDFYRMLKKDVKLKE